MIKQGKSENRSKRIVKVLSILVTLLLCGVILLVPFPTTVVPEWKITVLGQNGTPFANREVHEYWRHYSLESDERQDNRLTDENGYVVFPERTIWSPLLWRIISTSLAALEALIAHGSMGIDARVRIYDDSTGGGTKYYKPGETLANEIVIQRIQ